jgi:hypothetical protein
MPGPGPGMLKNTRGLPVQITTHVTHYKLLGRVGEEQSEQALIKPDGNL